MSQDLSANYNMQMTTTEKVAPLFQPVVNRHLIEVAKPLLVFSQFGQKVRVPKGKGKTIYWDKYIPLEPATAPLAEGVTPDGSALTVERISAEPQQYGNYVATTDEFDFYKHDPSPEVLKLGELLGENSAETFNALTCEVLAGGTNVQFAGGKTSVGELTADDIITLNDIKKAVRSLKNNKARRFGKEFVCILDPNTAHDLMQDEEWKNVKIHDPKDLYEGELGELYGVRFVETTETMPQNMKDSDVRYVYVLGKDAYGVTDVKENVETITHDKQSIGGPLNQYSTMGWKGHHLAKILVNEWLVRIVCKTSA